ncbi:type IV pilus secretin family protein [Iningainema tapete]|uniref:AMIN domain-containing protein n=1 Tax=Iningainema tapete BLCC-T55 TaxID=2748662 RepID=A0A8J7C0W7_9CYAN|nr:type IV pilus secretin family protein [Iningainema tapete]MBD2778818.1 AMIN domain-containing protein [Iningainema tapete BLCC-T55]
MILAAQAVWAQTTQVTQVQLKPVNGGINVILKTSNGDRPQIFTTKRDKALVADIINTKLRLPQGNSFRQDNPAPGIASVVINQLDTNSIRLIVTGTDITPNTQPVERKQDGITLNFTQGAGVAGKTPTPQNRAMPTPQNNNQPVAQTNPSQPNQKPQEVLVPNPQISIDGKPAPTAELNQPTNSAPPFLPRAVAPPVGDIAVSSTDASPSTVDLGTQQKVPRLVLRDAPVREVLSLLARAANLNLAYIGGTATPGPGGQQPAAAAAGGDGPTISLDIENEPVQDVFNYVLRLSGLEANRNGRTIFVGPQLPNSTRDTVMRSMRLNQVSVGVAVNFLVGLGAESAISRERQISTVRSVSVGKEGDSTTERTTANEVTVETRRADFKDSTPLLRSLQVLGDERTNAVTLIGSPRLVEIAMAQLTQLDIRRRQVAVNVKIIDVNLTGSQNFNTSFSFGVGNNFFVNDGGAAAMNFGGVNPPTSAQASLPGYVNPPVINNPYTGANVFVNPNNPITVPGTIPGTIEVSPGGIRRLENSSSGQFAQPYVDLNNPLQPGITNLIPAEDNIITVDQDGRRSVSQGTLGSITTSLPSLFQFPKRFLASLQAQVQNGNAKILTDPTLIVQEGQEANVFLTQEVVGRVKRTITDTPGGSREERDIEKEEVGLALAVKIDRIDDNGFVSLSVVPDVKAPAGVADTGDGQIVLVSQRSLKSGIIRLRDGQTLILSGIIQDEDRVTISKIPILGDIPLIGALFRKTNKSNERREVIVLLTPQIMDDSERSSYGYNYNPSPEVRQMLERRGLQTPKR